MKNKKEIFGINVYRKYNIKENTFSYYWNIIAKNGRELCRSSEVYQSKQACVKSIVSSASIICSRPGYTYHRLDGSKLYLHL